jgi:phosphatidylethanolamine-binding protein (PEBP) family uncharacterized protein
MLNNFVKLLAIIMIAGCQKTASTTSTSSETSTTTPTVANQLKFTGNGFVNNGTYPKTFTCDSLGVSPGLQWSNAPTATKSFAITMYHIPPGGGNHQYIVLYNIPATTLSIPDNSKSIGIFGINTVDGKATYTPPCSQGPGAKIYVLTLYALNAAPSITVPNTQVTMEILRAGMTNKILDSAVMNVTYTRP